MAKSKKKAADIIRGLGSDNGLGGMFEDKDIGYIMNAMNKLASG